MKLIFWVLALEVIAPQLLAAGPGLYDISDESHPKPINDQVAQVAVRSQSNDNKHYYLDFHASDHFSCSHIGLIVGKQIIRSNSLGEDSQGHLTSVGILIDDPDIALQIAQIFHTTVVKRHHPGNEMLVQFIPAQTEFANGQSVTVTLRITNIGSSDFAYIQGGRQRGARDNQFAFSAETYRVEDKMLPDIGDPRNFGGIGVSVKLKPGQSHEISVDLDRWFHFEKGGYYNIRGSYYMRFVDPQTHDFYPIWEDYAGGEFTIRIDD